MKFGWALTVTTTSLAGRAPSPTRAWIGFPNLTFDDQGFINLGPDRNAPQSTMQNLYQFTDNVS